MSSSADGLPLLFAGEAYGVMRFEEYGLGVCELLESSQGGALPAAHILQELGLSEADYRKLLEYLSSQGPVSQAMPRNPADMWDMQKTRSFYGWWEEKKQKYLPLSFDSKRLARTLLESKPDLTRVRRPWERLGWEYGERYRRAAAELIQEGVAEEDRVSDQEMQFYHLAVTHYGAQCIRRDFRLGPGGLARAWVGTWTGEGPRQDPGMRGHVFVSYSRQDEAYTRELVNDLQERGFKVWIDDRIDFGDRWWQTIDAAIKSCAAFVVVMTPESEASEWVEREVHLAMREAKPIFPLLLRGEGLSLLIDKQHVDVTDGRTPPQSFHDRLREMVPVLDDRGRVGGVELSGTSTYLPAPLGDVELVLIPAGEFTMGGVAYPNRVNLDAFYIAKHPITNAQYKHFTEATAHESPSHWFGRVIPNGKENHPVVQVTWHQARCYCLWLCDETGHPFRLPTEAEYEKAAQGTRPRTYPWGDEFDASRCNTKESDIGDTTPTGIYSPEGDSPYGVADMAGNVWEWTSTIHKHYKEGLYDAGDGREDPDAEGHRVLRGGSFNNSREAVACAYHEVHNDPNEKGREIGFRIAVSVHSRRSSQSSGIH